MKMFNKENLDFLSTSPGNYIFKNKSNKSEFGKFSSIFHVLASLGILLFYLISYIKGKEMNVIYSKKNTIPKNENDKYEYYNNSEKYYSIFLQTDHNETIKDKFEVVVKNKNNDVIDTIQEYSNDKVLEIYFMTSDIFYIYINKTEKYNFSKSNILYIGLFYTTSSMNDEDPIGLKKNELFQSESFFIDIKKKNNNNVFYLKKNYIAYRDGIRLHNFLSYLFFWTHYETTYVDFYYNNYFSFNYETEEDVQIASISNDNIEMIEGEDMVVDYYQRKYETFFNILSKWCGIFCTLKIFFTSIVDQFSFSYNNYELIKYIDKKNEMNKIIIISKENNNLDNSNSINKMKTIDLNKINNKEKYFKKIKTRDLIKYTFFSCCYKKTRTYKFINDCNNFVTKHISIEEIFYNMLCLENIIEEYNFKDNNHLKKYDEMKNKIESYENEMNLIDKNKDNKNQNLNSNLIDKSSIEIPMNENKNSIND